MGVGGHSGDGEDQLDGIANVFGVGGSAAGSGAAGSRGGGGLAAAGGQQADHHDGAEAEGDASFPVFHVDPPKSKNVPIFPNRALHPE